MPNPKTADACVRAWKRYYRSDDPESKADEIIVKYTRLGLSYSDVSDLARAASHEMEMAGR
jgi:hypothetical protein